MPSITGGGAPLFPVRPPAPGGHGVDDASGDAAHLLVTLDAGLARGRPPSRALASVDDAIDSDASEPPELRSSADRVTELARTARRHRAHVEQARDHLAGVAGLAVSATAATREHTTSGGEPPRLLPVVAIVGAALLAAAGLVLFLTGR